MVQKKHNSDPTIDDIHRIRRQIADKFGGILPPFSKMPGNDRRPRDAPCGAADPRTRRLRQPGIAIIASSAQSLARRPQQNYGNNSGRAAWGLTYGVTPEARPVVEERLLRGLPEETNRYTPEQELRPLAKVATEKFRGYLKRVVESELEPEPFKQQARAILDGLGAKR